MCCISMKCYAQFSPATYPFNNTKLPLELRLNDLVERLTTDEKIGMLWESAASVPRLGIDKYYYGNEGLHGYEPGKLPFFRNLSD